MCMNIDLESSKMVIFHQEHQECVKPTTLPINMNGLISVKLDRVTRQTFSVHVPEKN